MKTPSLLFTAAFMAALGSSSAATATDYIVGGGSGGDTEALFQVSTDGKIGHLTSRDITGVVALADPDFAAIPGEVATFEGDDLTATATALFYDFDAPPGDFLLSAILPGDLDTRLAGYGEYSGNGEGFVGPAGDAGPSDFINYPNLHGDIQISISPAPEPSTWALLLSGVAFIGSALRLSRWSWQKV